MINKGIPAKPVVSIVGENQRRRGIMKIIWCVTILIGCTSLIGRCQTEQILQIGNTEPIAIKDKGKCPDNPDSFYDRRSVLANLADVLNASAPGFKKYEDKGFYVQNERPQNFFVFDLTDPTNKATPSSGCINFLRNHIYHFAARYTPFSLSHVAILDGGQLKLFKAINCENSKDSVDDVIKYAETRLNLEDRNEVIQRVRDYRRYGEYFTVDDVTVRCNQVSNTNERLKQL